jgi:xanthine dehydrogenase accessory factor
VANVITDLDLLNQVADLLEHGNKVALCTIVEKQGSGPREVGAKMVVSENGEIVGTIGGGNLERALINESLKVLDEGKPKKIVVSLRKNARKATVETGLICGGELTIFIDVIKPKQRLIIVGAGHTAEPLAKLADILGYSITIIDDDEKLANRKKFPMAEKIVTGNFADTLDQLDVNPKDFVVIVHGEPEHDYLALKKMLEKKPAYVGLLGSKTKIAILAERLKADGFNPRELKSLHAPVGLYINAQSPEEIGISILAEIIREGKHRKPSA